MKLWTYDNLRVAFRRSYPCLYLWQRYDGLPAIKNGGRVIAFDPDAVVAWAKAKGHDIYLDKDGNPQAPIKLERRALTTAEA